MKLTLNRFLGELPKFDPALLPETNATMTRDVIVERGSLQPFHASKTYRTVTHQNDLQTIYRFGAVPGDDHSGWLFSWEKDVDVARGPVSGNTQELTYWTGDSFPRFTDNSIATAGGGRLPAGWRRLGVPAPAFGPQLALKALPDAPSGEKRDVSTDVDRDYVVTFTQKLGSLVMEGPPSTPSAVITVPVTSGVQLTNIAEPSGDGYAWSGKRLYRRLYSGGNTQLSLVAELTLGTSTYFDQLQDAEIPGDLLVSLNYDPPPETMHSLGVLSNGIMFGASDNDICLSEPYLPHAWSPLNRYPLPYPIVGMGQTDNQIVILTEKNPYLLVGTSPAAMSMAELHVNQGCVSKRSIVSGDFGCIYASPDGLMLVKGGAAQLITAGLFTQRQWQDMNPKSLISAVSERLYYGTYTTATDQRETFVFDPANLAAGVRHLSQAFTAARHDGLLDSLLVFDPAQDKVCLWNQGGALKYRWYSRRVYLPKSICFTAARVEADSYTDMILVLINEIGVTTRYPVSNNKAFRLPAGCSTRFITVGIESRDSVRFISIAESPRELD